jgi:FkbM family methyltransferase
MSESNYAWGLSIISDHKIKINRVAEIGSRDALDAIFLAKFFHAKVDVFEPEPANIEVCKKNIFENHEATNIIFHDFALSNKNETVNFLSIDSEKYDNPGAGGFYEIDFTNRPKSDPDYKRDSIQKSVAVQARRFDSLAIPAPNLIAMDVQGAELIVLQGFGKKLKDVKVIIFETAFSRNYIGGSTYLEVHNYLIKNNFSYMASDRYKQKKPHLNYIRRLLNQYQPDFNCLYVNELVSG